MNHAVAFALLGLLLAPTGAGADCVQNRYGKVVCGKGQCETDRYGNVYCAEAGGGAAAVDTYGKVKCLGGCEKGSKKHCQEAKE